MSSYIESSYLTEKRHLLNKKRALRLELDDLFNELFSIIDLVHENEYWKKRINTILDNLLKIYKKLNDVKSDDEKENKNTFLNIENITELLKNLKLNSDNNIKNNKKNENNKKFIALDEITNSDNIINNKINDKNESNNIKNISRLNSLFQQLSLVQNIKTVKNFQNKKKNL